MNLWKFFMLLLMLTSCVHNNNEKRNANNEKPMEEQEKKGEHTYVDEIPVYDSAFMIRLPPDLKKSKAPRKIFSDDVLYLGAFLNVDSTVKVDVKITSDTSRSLDGIIPAMIDELRHFDPGLLVLKKELLKQYGAEMASVVYEVPPVRGLPGDIVERRMFITPKGRATVDVTCRFLDPEKKQKNIMLVKTITESIKVIQ